MSDHEREPTPDEQAGMNWWNGLTETERAHWLRQAGSAAPANAWEAFKRQREGGAA